MESEVVIGASSLSIEAILVIAGGFTSIAISGFGAYMRVNIKMAELTRDMKSAWSDIHESKELISKYRDENLIEYQSIKTELSEIKSCVAEIRGNMSMLIRESNVKARTET